MGDGGNHFWWNSTTSESPCVVFQDVRKPDGAAFQRMGFDHHLSSMLEEDMNWKSPPMSFSSEEDDSPTFNNNHNYSSSISFRSLFENEINNNHQQQQQQQRQSIFDYNSSSFLQQSADISENSVKTCFFPLQSQFVKPCFDSKTKMEEIGESTFFGKSSSRDQPASPFKRPRIETPSSLPTFKVRKEKLGDRVTALQQLVSPFGKTDTASVLHEAVDYIKFLQDQVNVLSSAYVKNGGSCSDLKSRGLCVVPISSTFVANETTSDFWIPTFGATFK